MSQPSDLPEPRLHDRADSGSRHRRRARPTWRAPSGSSARRPRRGAQIICLKELFNAPYFCKSQQSERFDLAEPIPGPTTDAMTRLARELAVVLIVPIFERQAAGRLPEFGRHHRRRRQRARGVSQDAHPRRSAVQREVLLHAGRHAGLPGVEDALRDDRRADLLGSVVPGGGADHEPAGRARSSSIRRRSAGTRRSRTSGATRRWTRGGRCSARTRSPTASTSRRPIASATRTSRAPTASTFFGRSFIADPFGRYLAEAGGGEAILIATLRSGADRDRAPQLAVPPRSPHRRLRPDPRALPRR